MKRFNWLSLLMIAALLTAATVPTVWANDDLTDLVDQVNSEQKADDDEDDDDEDDDDDDPLAEALELGAGVHAIEKNKKGDVETCVIIGSASISQALSPNKAMQLATKRARTDMMRQFLRFLNEDANLYETEENEFIVAEEGSVRDKELTKIESAKSISKNSDKFTSTSKALVQGMEIIGKKQDGKNRTLYLVYGWSSENAAAAKKLSDKSQKGSKKGSTAKSDKKGKDAAEKGDDTDIEDKTVISKRAKKYFKNK